MFFFFSLSLFVKSSPPFLPLPLRPPPPPPLFTSFRSFSFRQPQTLPPSSSSVHRHLPVSYCFILLRWSSQSRPVLQPITSNSVRPATFGRCWSSAAFCDYCRQPLTGFVDLGRFKGTLEKVEIKSGVGSFGHFRHPQLNKYIIQCLASKF
ncbi:unnamed protein product [Citrullus colocynthis]|uniref:Uncharacterized protein n=1 Tax=Citrullus colocynthis TaxID=252529 RepID=A0ABP0YG84_9ROSI